MSNNRTIAANANSDLATFTIFSNGAEISRAYQVLSIDVLWELNRIPAATIVCRDGEAATGNFDISNTTVFEPGMEIEIKAGYRSSEDTVFKGIVIRHSIKIREGSSLLIVECRDKAVKMTSRENSKYFNELKDSEIMEAVISDAGLTAEVQATQTKHQEVIQYHTTDWDFLLTRADLAGHLVLVDDGKVKTASPNLSQSPVLNAVFGSSLLELDAEIDARDAVGSVKSLSWDAANQEVAERESQAVPSNNQGNLSSDDLAIVAGKEEIVMRHPGAVSKQELQSWANARLQKSRLAKIRGRARFQGTALIKPGNVIELEGVGDRFNGNAFVSGVRHQIGNGSWRTNAQLGMDPSWFAVRAGLSGNTFSGTIQGLHTGVVTALEKDPSGEDRIQVRIPMVSQDAAGAWCRLSTLDAGNGRGTCFRPEIGDEVTVGFLGADPRHPVVLGMLHSSAKPAPIPAQDDNHIKGMVSRAGMKWTFDDEKKIITFETPGGNKILLSDEDSGITLEDQNGNKIVMNSDGIELKAAKSLKTSAGTSAKIEGTTLELAGQSSTEIKSSGNLKMTAGGIAEVQGSLVKIN